MRFLKVFFGIIFIAGIAAFLATNADKMTVNLWSADISYEIPAFWLILICFVAGFIFGALVEGTVALQLKMQNKRLRKQMATMEKELDQFRTQPFQDISTGPQMSGSQPEAETKLEPTEIPVIDDKDKA